MLVDNVKIYDLNESIKASKYPMATNTFECSSDITKTVKSLAQSGKGEGHDQFLTGIRVAFDLTFSNKAWIEAERYRFLEFVSSQSCMHRITRFNIKEQCNQYVWNETITKLTDKVSVYNRLLERTKDYPELSEIAKELYLEIIYNIPSGFQLTARMTTNYRALKTIYAQRKNHRLPEWREFCKWIESLPYANELIIGKEGV